MKGNTVTSFYIPLTLFGHFSSDQVFVRAQPESVALDETSRDYFCGQNWPDAAESCSIPCPTGDDNVCVDALGEDHGCFFFTGCWDKLQNGGGQGNGGGTNAGGNGSGGDEIEVEEEVSSGASNNYCGKSWLGAMITCNDPCPGGWECADPDDTCYAATNCDKPLIELISDMLVTLAGPDTPMDGEEGGIFSGTIMDVLREVAEEEGIALDQVDLTGQTLVSRRELEERRLQRLNDSSSIGTISISNITQRMLPSGSSALDVSMVITGDYRPPPYLDLDVIAEDSINRQGDKVISNLRDRGARAGRDFFERVDGIEAVSRAKMTARPTQSPTGKPTPAPTGVPFMLPSMMPSVAPSDIPSSVPSRAIYRSIMMGSSQDLLLGESTTSSYGYAFNMRTPNTLSSAAMVITGMDIYVKAQEDVNYEIWSRLGNFRDYKGNYDGWDLIATGTVRGRGIGRYTTIPEDTFSPVSVPGGGSTRAFYITLDSNNLIFKIGQLGTTYSDEIAHDANEDIEIWEGESVLFYPFPDPEEAYFYRYPRQFLGAIYYDRLPCKPFSMYGLVQELPCPDVPTGSPTLPQPTKSPVTLSPSLSPVTVTPTNSPTAEGQTKAPITPPTRSPVTMNPTASPTTGIPTTSPIVPMRAYVISTIRNVPDRDMTSREIEKLLEILTKFLKKHTDTAMVIDGIDFWHQQLTSVEADSVESPLEGGKLKDETPEGELSADSGTEPNPVRKLEENGKKGMKVKQEPLPQVTAAQITLILRISFAFLPLDLLGNMAAVAIDENQAELLPLFNEQAAFYTYFKEMDKIESFSVDKVTERPTTMPSTYDEYLANQAALNITDDLTTEDEGISFIVFVGIGVGVLWCCLLIASFTYLYKVRSQLTEDLDLQNLLSQEKANPLESGSETKESGDEDDWKGRSASTHPIGTDEEELANDDSHSVHSFLTDSVNDDLEEDIEQDAPLSKRAAKNKGMSKSLTPVKQNVPNGFARRTQSTGDFQYRGSISKPSDEEMQIGSSDISDKRMSDARRSLTRKSVKSGRGRRASTSMAQSAVMRRSGVQLKSSNHRRMSLPSNGMSSQSQIEARSERVRRSSVLNEPEERESRRSSEPSGAKSSGIRPSARSSMTLGDPKSGQGISRKSSYDEGQQKRKNSRGGGGSRARSMVITSSECEDMLSSSK